MRQTIGNSKRSKSFYSENIMIYELDIKLTGGTGLNLTGADMVIHYDPWWNLAAQNQATDRVHRIVSIVLDTTHVILGMCFFIKNSKKLKMKLLLNLY